MKITSPFRRPRATQAGDDAKLFVLIESGVRVHLTTYERDKAQIPSNFTLKLRKHVRTRRIEKVEQLGADRASACGAGPPRWCHSFGPRLPHALQRSAPVAAQHGAAAKPVPTPLECTPLHHANPNLPHPSPNPNPHPHPKPGVIVITCGSGVAEHTLIIELYDKGNLVLTDKDLSILTLLRRLGLGLG